MQIWTIQNEAAWAYLRETGQLHASREHQAEEWPEAYEWIRSQLIRRVGPPPTNDAVPLWGWYQWQGRARMRPDLRTLRHHWGSAGNTYVLIECELPDDRVMLSDFEAWHVILNGRYLSPTDEEEAAYLADRKRYDQQPSEALAENLRQRYYGSWERVIDIEALTEPDWHAMDNKSIQACFWEVRKEQVRYIKPFVTTGLRGRRRPTTPKLAIEKP